MRKSSSVASSMKLAPPTKCCSGMSRFQSKKAITKMNPRGPKTNRDRRMSEGSKKR
jgi:hypothetical protein